MQIESGVLALRPHLLTTLSIRESCPFFLLNRFKRHLEFCAFENLARYPLIYAPYVPRPSNFANLVPYLVSFSDPGTQSTRLQKREVFQTI